MLDELMVKVYKTLVLNSSDKVFKGRISDLAKITGLSTADIIKALQALDKERYIQITFIDSLNIFRGIFDELIEEEARYIEVLTGLQKANIDDVRRELARLRNLALQYASGNETSEFLKAEIEKVSTYRKLLSDELVGIFLLDDTPQSASDVHTREIFDDLILHIKKLSFFLESKGELSDEDIILISTHLSLYINVPVMKKTTVKKGAQNILRSVELLQQTLEEIELRILIEGTTPELAKLREEVTEKINSLNKLLVSLKEEKKVYFISDDIIHNSISNISLKKEFCSKLIKALNENNPAEVRLRELLSKMLIFLEEEEKLLRKILTLIKKVS